MLLVSLGMGRECWAGIPHRHGAVAQKPESIARLAGTTRQRGRAMPRAIWNGTVIAQSDETVLVDGNHYFPADSLLREYFEPSEHTSRCSWKGRAQYFHIRVGEERNESAAWTYPKTRTAAKPIEGYFAFWRGVSVEP